MNHSPLSQATAVDLLRGLVAIPSLSREEAAATAWLVEQMQALGFERAFVDDVGNAVGEIGATDAGRTVVLLGHIDTVPGNIPVRIESVDGEEVLYGRGSVDAKGPLAAFVAAAASLGSAWAREQGVRLVVVGAVEEEAATSKGARFIRDRFDGVEEPVPDGCIIGEPSGWRRVTLGYKGRLLIELEARQPMMHTAGPDRGVATVATAWWEWIAAYVDQFNERRDKAFDQLLPSLREINTFTDGAMNDGVRATVSIRLPLGFDVEGFVAELGAWAAARGDGVVGRVGDGWNGQWSTVDGQLSMGARGVEAAFRGGRNNALVRGFLGAIREVAPGARPSFVSKTGTSDMNVVGPAWSCPIVAYGPGDAALDHTPREHLSLAEYWLSVRVLRAVLPRL